MYGIYLCYVSVNTYGAMSNHSCEWMCIAMCLLTLPRAPYRNVGYSHLGILPTPNIVSHHSNVLFYVTYELNVM